jgi:glycosyltransferase involved in cell wall biosynthesis
MEITSSESSKYVFLIPSLRPGGAEKTAVKLANQFVIRGQDISIWVRELSTNDLRHELDPRIKIKVIGGGGFLSTSFKLCKQLSQTDVASFLVFNYFLLAPLVISKYIFLKNYKINYRIISSLSLKTNTEGGAGKQYFARLIVRTFAPFADSIIAQCSAMKEDAARFLVIPENRIKTIYNPVAKVEISHPKPKTMEVLFIGRLIPIKGIHYILESFIEVVKSEPSATLRIVGDGPLMNVLKDKIKDFDLTNKVKIEGYKSEVNSFYQNAKVTVLTSSREGFPNVLVESINNGTPVVSFNCQTGPSEIIVDGLNGFLIPLFDTNELTKKILITLRSDFDPYQIKLTARKFDLDLITDEYMKICKP